MMEEVEIIKIGIFWGFDKTKLIILRNSDPIVDYYVDMLIEAHKEDGIEYSYIKTGDNTIITQKPYIFRKLLNKGIKDDCKYIKGIPDYFPIIGKIFSINNGNWGTSLVDRIINDTIIITNNSIYAIHSIGYIRNKKLDYLGI